MKYDEIKQEALVSDTIEETTKLANTILKSIEVYITNSHTQSPLARYYNLLVVLDQVDDIYQQTRNAAIDYLREAGADIKTLYNENDWEDELKRTPSKEQDGLQYKLLQIPNYRNLAPKDTMLNSLILSERETKAALKRIAAKIAKRIAELLSTKEHQKAKPKEVGEVLVVESGKLKV